MKRRDSGEWGRNYDELFACAAHAVRDRLFGTHRENIEADIIDLAQQAITELSEQVIDKCETVDQVYGFLSVRARSRAGNFVSKRSIRNVRLIDDLIADDAGRQAMDVLLQQNAAPENDEAVAEARNDLLNRLGLRDFQMRAVVDALVLLAHLNVLEAYFFKRHMVGSETQQHFAERFGVPLGTLGGMKKRIQKKLRQALELDQFSRK